MIKECYKESAVHCRSFGRWFIVLARIKNKRRWLSGRCHWNRFGFSARRSPEKLVCLCSSTMVSWVESTSSQELGSYFTDQKQHIRMHHPPWKTDLQSCQAPHEGGHDNASHFPPFIAQWLRTSSVETAYWRMFYPLRGGTLRVASFHDDSHHRNPQILDLNRSMIRHYRWWIVASWWDYHSFFRGRIQFGLLG